ncbi:odorant receptor 131-2-like [Thunnus albacares]|uniref:odorant receptor 131-2-like n=1 Tax=Thunnus albacares TaxID=8236 RepID=UPI001CF61562|nr:odorant receptor 131-2-like [Thunnus albacares]
MICFFVYALSLQMLYEAVIMNNTTEVTQVMPFREPVKALLSMLPCLLFLYVNAVMLFALLRKPFLLESSRYILFGHLLIIDTLQLLVTMLLYLFAETMVRMISYVCVTVILLSVVTYTISPINLAVMSLERYVAICFPLRHTDITTNRTTGIAVSVMWILASLDSLTQFFLFISLENTGFILQSFCARNNVFRLKIYSTVYNAFTAINFMLVSLIIIYTYIAIMIVVKSASANVHEAMKACKTVLLHLFQLCLCLISTLFHMISPNKMMTINTAMAVTTRYVLFVSLIVFPKCLSPLIYGLRDDTLRHIFRYYFTFGFKVTIKPSPKS